MSHKMCIFAYRQLRLQNLMAKIIVQNTNITIIKPTEFEGVGTQAGLNAFTPSPKNLNFSDKGDERKD